ncbi:MAG: tRNA (adenosine(37)-N6)-threonylcarbamoyltransferase complex ATPase subunit type 1 TsaE [Clostridia bacterium]|nr:tRNA (adenosine(37)-N6)-threonylcarbamoyltransferase complex ATPase subunit type 1 TsaE [Clostridia bacterium]
MIYTSNSADETYDIAAQFAKKLNKGDVITLDGDLGAGKTAFTRGVAAGLGLRDVVVSPTFTIVNEYRKGDIALFHFDVYRLECADDLYDIGWDDYISADGICIVEWSSIVPECFDMPHYRVVITKNPALGDDCRQISIEYIGGTQ